MPERQERGDPEGGEAGLAVQGKPVDIGGYYQPDDKLASAALRPTGTFNGLLAVARLSPSRRP